MKLRNQNFIYFGVYMILVIVVIFTIDYGLIKHYLKHKAEEDLKLRCEEIHKSIQSSLNSGIENYLRGITEAYLDIVKNYYEKYKNGEITEEAAKNAIQAYCNRQTIGTSGYIVAVRNIEGRLILDLHPFKRLEDCTEETGCMVWDSVRNGYAEYDWKNPEDNRYKMKVAYLKEFPEWNWVFGATSYKSEFTQLFNVEDLKSILASVKINGSGYAILYDNEHNLIYHPMLEKYQDESFLNEQSSIVEKVLSATGEISLYDWKNPDDIKPKQKYAYTQKIPEFDFYLIVTGYMTEIYSPINKIIYITLLLSVSAILLLLLSVFINSRKVVTPIQKIIDGIHHYYHDKTPFMIPETSVNEIKTLAISFNNMTKEIDKQMEEKQQTIEQVQQMNIQLEYAKEKAEESDRLKTAFLANMSHEIRTPMNGILGFTGLLKNPQLTGENQSKFIEIIEKSGQRMLNTINDIIDISKIEAGQVDVVNKKVAINKILNEQYTFFETEAEAKSIEFSYFSSLTDNESIVLTDEKKLESILTNLIKNALKYTEKGSVFFGYSLKTEMNNKVLEFFVSDTGIGIPPHRKNAIFNRFEQSDIEDSRVFEGSGLGLAISKSYAKMLGGDIHVSSKEGVGSTFKFTIPYNPYSTNDAAENLQNRIKINNEISWGNLNLIVAEDDDVSRQFFIELFENKFQNISYVTNGKEAIDECRANPSTNIILMDIKMPVMDGLEATREIRKFNKEVIIIAQSAYCLSGDKEKALEAGCDDYIVKPIKKNELIEIINKHLDYRAKSPQGLRH